MISYDPHNKFTKKWVQRSHLSIVTQILCERVEVQTQIYSVPECELLLMPTFADFHQQHITILTSDYSEINQKSNV